MCPGPIKNKAQSKRDSNPQWRVMSTLLNHQLFEFAVRAFQDTVSRFMRDSNPRPPGPKPGAPQLELMDLEGLLSVSFQWLGFGHTGIRTLHGSTFWWGWRSPVSYWTELCGKARPSLHK